ncbi:MAG: Asp-tRNA(Asn)/Glu-tRNA(Gln) amidotransferase subunit GatB [Oscillospiraceae bacterium]|nr:Asp-tRNA(Asn)/Glu-tRNA(Gln) amidotransferase subunit GatB [Oscillospiraceae bacterium]
MTNYETVMGIEVHVELATNSKIFCGCSASYGDGANAHVCEGCAGMPGTLPSLNRRVVEYAVRAGLALNCEISEFSRFDRKNYFYPDLPAAYQVTQMFHPICKKGHLDIVANGKTKTVGINRIHIEEDAGKLVHDSWDDCSLVDYNRCSVPLIEIVSEPDFRTAEEVVAYLEKLKSTLQYLGVSDCKMQEGSMRADINISVRPVGTEKFGVRTEMKNMASLKSIARAIAGEAERHIDVIESGGTLYQETRRWDDNKGVSFAMRNKENAQDYKYFPDPNLMPVIIGRDYIQSIRETLPELQEEKRARYIREFELPEYDADILTGSKYLVDVFERTTGICKNPKEASNWVMTELLKLLNDAQMQPEDMKFDPDSLGRILKMIAEGKINRAVGKKTFAAVFESDVDPVEYVEKNGLLQVSDAGAIEPIIREVLDSNEKAVSEYLGGNEKSIQFLIGQSMKALRGKGDPQAVREMLIALLNGRREG